MSEITHRELETNGIRMHVAEQGTGPLVVLCHGFPESWYSWRHQLAALSAAGFHAVAPDMRGYGRTDAPAEIEAYTLCHLVGDMVGLVGALGETSAVIAGHDWGAPVAWHAALMRPDVFRAVIGLSVPYRPRGPVRPTTAMPRTDDTVFYQLYFQTPGVAEAELEQDVRATIRRLAYGGSGDAPARETIAMVPRRCRPGSLPPTSSSTRASSLGPAFAAGSTGIATSIAAGSCWPPSPALASACRRSTSPAIATSSFGSRAWISSSRICRSSSPSFDER